MLLSIAMIVKDEEYNIRRCLEALKVLDNNIQYEIVVVDTGSSDNTVSIAKEYTNKVYEHIWNGNFAQMRNISIKYCKGKWILVLDADEVLENAKELIKFLKGSDSKKYNCVTINFKNLLSDNKNNFLLGSLVRLFKNTKDFYYKGRVHEQPNLLAPVGFTNITLLHYGYSRVDYKLMEYKYKRNKELLLKDLDEGKDPIYTYFQLAQTYAMANKTEESFNFIKKSFNLVKNQKEKIKYLYIYHFYAREEIERFNNEKVIEICEEALKYSKEHLDFFYMAAKAYSALEKYNDARNCIEDYLNLYNKIKNGYIIRDISVNSFSFCRKDDILKEKIVCNFKEKKYKNIYEIFSEIEIDSIREEVKQLSLYSCIKTKQFNNVFKYYKEKLIEDNDIQCLVNIFKKLKDESESGEINEELNGLYDLDKRLNIYIDNIYFNKLENCIHSINLNNFTNWKAEYLIKLFTEDQEKFEVLKHLPSEDIRAYINYAGNNYKCISLLYDYSEENLLSCDIDVLNLVNIIEEILLFNKSIDDDKYDKLVRRTYINKIYYIRFIYNKDIISSEKFINILNRQDRVWIDIEDAVNIYNEDKLEYIKKLKTVLKHYPEYNRVVKIFLNNIEKNNVTESMIKEKEYLLSMVESLVNENQIDRALEILEELEGVFRFDWKIYNYLGVIQYMKQDYKKGLLNLGLSAQLKENEFDTIYNIGCVFECIGRFKEAKYYYNVSYELCNNEEFKKNILEIIKSLNI